MSNTDFLRTSELGLLPAGFVQDQVFDICIGSYHATAEVDGYNPETGEAIEICQSETEDSPKPGQKRKMASDAFKLIFLIQQGVISRGKIYVTSEAMYTWTHQSGSWLSAACRAYSIHVELKRQDRKTVRKRIRNVMRDARREMR